MTFTLESAWQIMANLVAITIIRTLIYIFAHSRRYVEIISVGTITHRTMIRLEAFRTRRTDSIQAALASAVRTFVDGVWTVGNAVTQLVQVEAKPGPVTAVLIRPTVEVVVGALLAELVRLVHAVGLSVAQPAARNTQQLIAALELVRGARHRQTGGQLVRPIRAVGFAVADPRLRDAPVSRADRHPAAEQS